LYLTLFYYQLIYIYGGDGELPMWRKGSTFVVKNADIFLHNSLCTLAYVMC